LIRLGERISYRQMCLLALFAYKEKFGLRQESYDHAGKIGETRVALLQEIYELDSQGMLNASGTALIDLPGVMPGKMNVQGTGTMLYNLMELWKVDMRDLSEIAMLLQ